MGPVLLGFLLVVFPIHRLSGQAPGIAEEYRLKAAFLVQFPQFVEWPASAFTGRDALEMCVSRPNPFGTALQSHSRGESFMGRPLMVREIDPDEEIDSCHVLFISTQPTDGLNHLLFRASMLPILTIGETGRFLDDGGIIKLRIVERRVRFDVNAAAADRVGMRISSQLLRLALEVRMGLP